MLTGLLESGAIRLLVPASVILPQADGSITNMCPVTMLKGFSFNPRSVLKTILVGSAAILLFSRSVAGQVLVVEPGSDVAGYSMAELIPRFINWTIMEPLETNELADTTGEFQHLNQEGPVWFLPRDYGPIPEINPSRFTRDLSFRVPSDRYLFVPVSWAHACADSAENSLEDDAGDLYSTSPWSIVFSVGDVTLTDHELTSDFRLKSGVYQWEAKAPSLIDEMNDASGYCALDGSFVAIEPLPPGEYTLEKGEKWKEDDWEARWIFNITSVLPGDLDRNGVWSATDLDSLAEAIATNQTDVYDDVNVDGQVDLDDHRFWVESLAGTFFGDADLNGNVDFTDFVELSSNFGKSGGWAQGDFDGDGDVAFPDFVLLSSNFGDMSQAPASQSVPEPTAAVLTLTGCLWVFGRRKRFDSAPRNRLRHKRSAL